MGASGRPVAASPDTPVTIPVVPSPHSARVIDALLMGLLVVRLPAPGLSVPTAQVAVLVLLAISLFRRPTRSLAPVAWYPLGCLALLTFCALESRLNGIAPDRRLVNLATLMLMAAFLASGRIDIGSALKGLATALALNVVLFQAGLAPDEYGGKLTGLLADKNPAGLFYAVVPLLFTLVTRRRWLRVAVLAAGATGVVLTDSRTTMAAYAAALVWLAVSPRLGRGFQLVSAAGLAVAFQWANSNLAEIGGYASERSGSDALRARIDAAATLKAQGAPWYGRGLGAATVQLDGNDWFFHNSYEALRVEGGVVMLLVVLVAYCVSALGLPGRRPEPVTSHEARAVFAATLVVLMCATRLGEVFLAPIGLFLVGVGLARVSAAHRGEQLGGAPPQPRTAGRAGSPAG